MTDAERKTIARRLALEKFKNHPRIHPTYGSFDRLTADVMPDGGVWLPVQYYFTSADIEDAVDE